MERMEEATAGGIAMLLQVAIDYGGRDELVRAFEKLHREYRGVVTEDDIADALDTAGIPDPDLIVRTGGNNRTSNFMPWQSVYAEWYFTDTLWPALTIGEVSLIIDLYHGVERRFGALSAAAE
jgi:undecaprenyl diphosphate synthase